MNSGTWEFRKEFRNSGRNLGIQELRKEFRNPGGKEGIQEERKILGIVEPQGRAFPPHPIPAGIPWGKMLGFGVKS